MDTLNMSYSVRILQSQVKLKKKKIRPFLSWILRCHVIVKNISYHEVFHIFTLYIIELLDKNNSVMIISLKVSFNVITI